MKRKFVIDQGDIEARIRLRPLFEYLKDLSAGAPTECTEDEANKLAFFMSVHGFEYGDLVALRERPHHWDRFYADQWTWLLHQVMNKFSNVLNVSLG